MLFLDEPGAIGSLEKYGHRAVAGAVKTPTPQLMAEATGVIFNPYWNVPKSIEPEVRGKSGYEAIRDDAGNIVRYRQPPGPSPAGAGPAGLTRAGPVRSVFRV